ncbi:alpha-galactosidase-like [Quercus lobata]|uniref:alpha-galactosidase-like n=1 Tax=Quercus lobata TaxID=97700 RepID=UPI00124757EB|nr:alpha-galactosidase-like [Quercus lobata]XP_030959174.1 alpha-galactosidase-like [Quercus lobata]
MNIIVIVFASLYFLFILLNTTRLYVEAQYASSPPRGWNSYDSFSWTISEKEFLDSAQFISDRLLSSGYEYVVVDYLWYRRKVEGADADSSGFDVIDEWGRMVPDPDRWPSSVNGNGFTEVANKVHSMGLKFGIHVMSGISTQAVNANTLILDTKTGEAFEEGRKKWTAQDIGIKERPCSWMPHGFMSVNTTARAGAAFLRSLYTQYAEWGVDLVKHDCVFGGDLDIDEISVVSEVLKQLDHPILYSLSPGTRATPAMAKDVSGLVNMYRITGDDWDSWENLVPHFDVSRDFAAANMIGATGLKGKSWPDLDMLPLGWLTDPESNEGPHRTTNLTPDEQKSQVTLWSMAKSPLMFGGDVRNLDNATYDLITNEIVLEINSFSSNNMEFPYVTNGARSWIATGRDGEVYLAFFNVNTDQREITAMTSDMAKVLPGKNLSSCLCHELWSGRDCGVLKQSLSKAVASHGCELFIMFCS